MSTPSLPQPGETFAGKYTIERTLGEGGMGTVLAAVHAQLGERVAIKMLRPESAGSAALIERFHREARAAAKLRGEHVARVLDFGTAEGGAPYLVLEYLEGHDLSQELRARGPLAASEVIDHVTEACEGVAEAHAAGIVHRDLKPSNIFLTQRNSGPPVVKILDFGISKATKGGDAKLTSTHAALGSPAYMSPEQCREAKNVDGRADIWSLGVTLYELLTGQLPFVAETLPGLIARVLDQEPEPPSFHVPSLPLELDQAVMRALSKRPEDRFPSLIEFSEALAPFGSRRAARSAERVAELLTSRPLPVWINSTPTSDPKPRTPSDPRRSPARPPSSPEMTTTQAPPQAARTGDATLPAPAPTPPAGRRSPARVLVGASALAALAAGLGLASRWGAGPPASPAVAAAPASEARQAPPAGASAEPPSAPSAPSPAASQPSTPSAPSASAAAQATSTRHAGPLRGVPAAPKPPATPLFNDRKF